MSENSPALTVGAKDAWLYSRIRMGHQTTSTARITIAFSVIASCASKESVQRVKQASFCVRKNSFHLFAGIFFETPTAGKGSGAQQVVSRALHQSRNGRSSKMLLVLLVDTWSEDCYRDGNPDRQKSNHCSVAWKMRFKLDECKGKMFSITILN